MVSCFAFLRSMIGLLWVYGLVNIFGVQHRGFELALSTREKS